MKTIDAIICVDLFWTCIKKAVVSQQFIHKESIRLDFREKICYNS